MKWNNLILSLVITLIASSSFAAAKSPKAEEKIRKAIDDICGDTWCEGDFRFDFSNVVLDATANQFTVNFLMTPYLDEETILDEASVSAIVKPGAQVACVVKGYSDAAGIVNKSGSLHDRVYDALSACIGALEDKLSK